MISLGFMGLSPSEFWGDPGDIMTGMSLREWDLFSRGFQQRQDVEQRRIAWLSANIMNCWAKPGKAITPDKLLGTEKPTEHAQMMREIREKKKANDEKKQQEIMKDLIASKEDQANIGEEDFAQQLLNSGAIIDDD